MNTPRKPNELFDALGRASVMGLHMVSGLAVGAGLGYMADKYFGTFPWISGIGLLFGIGAGFRNLWIDARYVIRHSEQREKP